MSTMGKNKKILLTMWLLVMVAFSIYTLGSEQNSLTKQEYVYIEANNYSFKSDHSANQYDTNSVNKLDIKFKEYSFNIRYVGSDDAYLTLIVDSNIILDKKQILVDNYYEEDYKVVDDNFHILYNEHNATGFLLLLGPSNEFPGYYVYKFSNTNFCYFKNFNLNDEIVNNLLLQDTFPNFKQGVFQIKQESNQYCLSYLEKGFDTIYFNNTYIEDFNFEGNDS